MKSIAVGHARRDITPPVGTWMMGYAARTKPCEGVHDPLFANAVAVSSDGERAVVIITLDVSSLDGEVVGRIRRGLLEAAGIGPEDVILNTSHTHSGPSTAKRTYAPRSDEYLTVLVAKAVDAASSALKDLKPSRLRVGSAPVDIGCNRRAETPDGKIGIGVNADAPRLAEVTVWRFVREDVDDLLLFSTPIHPSVMGAENYLLSGDWAGAARDAIEKRIRGVRAAFLPGCCGNQGAYRTERTFETVARHGETLATAVAGALADMTDAAGAPVVTRLAEAHLPFADGGSYPCPIHGLRLGDAVFVGIAGEVFVEYALFGREQSTAKSTIISGYTDGSIGYLPVAAAYEKGGYETGANRFFESGKPWDPSVEDVLKRAIADMLAALSEDTR